MPARDSRRAIVVAIVVAVAVGFVAGWFARVWTVPSPESRARDQVGEIRERVRQLTR